MIINKKTKIVATLGPATNTKETLTELGVERYCCRRQFMGYVPITEGAARLKKC